MGQAENGLLFIGEEGIIMTGTGGHKPRLVPESKMKSYEMPPKTLPRSPGHWAEWIAACKGGQPAGSNFDHAARVTEAVLLGTVALRPELREAMSKNRLEWDGPSLKVTNLDEANEFLAKKYREGWSL